MVRDETTAQSLDYSVFRSSRCLGSVSHHSQVPTRELHIAYLLFLQTDDIQHVLVQLQSRQRLERMPLLERHWVHDWIRQAEPHARYDLSGSLVDPLPLAELGLSFEDLENIPLSYGPLEGSSSFRRKVARYHSLELGREITPECVISAPAGAAANYTFLYSFIQPGDHVIVHYPTYQPLYSAVVSLGATVSFWETRLDDGWLLNVDDLERLSTPRTRLIILNNPQNPTGQTIAPETMHNIVAFAQSHDMVILCDEVFRQLSHSTEPIPSILSYGYKRVCATGSVSKEYSCAGLRLGWMISEDDEIRNNFIKGRDILTITVSPIIEALGEKILSEPLRSTILARNREILASNVQKLEEFVSSHQRVTSWCRSRATSIAFIKFHRDGKPLDDVLLCKRLLEDNGLMLVPGSMCYGAEYKGFVRVGLGVKGETLLAALGVLDEWLEENVGEMPMATGA